MLSLPIGTKDGDAALREQITVGIASCCVEREVQDLVGVGGTGGSGEDQEESHCKDMLSGTKATSRH